MQRVLPVIVSIIIIIIVAVLRNYSVRLSAIIATMPINIPLAIWIVYAGAEGQPEVMTEFSRGMLISIVPTLGFLVVAWIMFRSGWSILPVIGGGYIAWGVILVGISGLQRLFHF